ncbi:MAG: hypothetical protein M3Z10_02810 [Gemmatimonadota bacterium]|nr:hypothetical protein [Gemmatimonadota bacterium]
MLDPHQGDVVTDDGGMAQALYARPMPGGGYVRVELVVSDRGDVASERRRGRVVIEPRQAAPRRDDAVPLVVEELEGDDENSVVAELFRIANDNAAIARRVLRRRAEVRRAD